MKKSIVVGIILIFLLSSLIPITSSYSSYETSKIYTIHIDENGTLSGYVTDTAMNPIEGGRVRVYFHETYGENYTDSSGYYHVTNIPICYCLKNATVSKEGYTTEWVLLAIGENTTYDFVLTPLGKTLYVGGSGTGNYTKIQDAIDNASDDDYIFVFSGIYYENILIYKSLHLLGEKPDTTIIDGHGFKEVVIITADYVTIEQFTIRNSSHNLPYSYQRGIRVEANHTTISKNIIFDNLQTGIFLDQTSYSIISENNISQSCHGIWVLESSDNTITHNTIYDNTFGVLMSSSSKNQIIANIIHHNYEDGILLSHSTQNIVLNNTIYLNENDSIGINLDEAAYMNIIKSNIIAFHRNIGISTMGFFNVISDNTIQGNGLGIDLKAGYYNQIHRNNFIENHLDAEFTLGAICRILIPLARNNWIHNYWDDHHIRLPQLIPGTLSYPPDPSIPWERISIDWIEIDWFPAKEPYDIPKM